jgi:hypothetical protein
MFVATNGPASLLMRIHQACRQLEETTVLCRSGTAYREAYQR